MMSNARTVSAAAGSNMISLSEGIQTAATPPSGTVKEHAFTSELKTGSRGETAPQSCRASAEYAAASGYGFGQSMIVWPSPSATV